MKRAALGCLAIAIGAAWTALGDGKPSTHKRVPLKVIGPGSEFRGQLWGQTFFPPLLSFVVKEGAPPPDKTVVLCDVVETEHDHITHISLRCEEGLVIELEGIDLRGGQQ